MKADIGLIGLGAMGQNLALNMESKGYAVSVYDIDTNVALRYSSNEARGRNITPAYTLEELVKMLSRPRKIWLMIKAGPPVDEVIETLLPLLEKGDIIIDGGNSHFTDTIRRTQYVESKDLLYIGAGVSGGTEGARNGPSIMPGGSQAAWAHVKAIFQSIAAKVDGSPCCEWIGADGAGHFVKMVHNGIEYGDMQLICEAYFLMKEYLGMDTSEMRAVFSEWNKGDLESYLIGVTRDILAFRDESGEPLLEKILDTAGQKDTGKWALIASLDEGVPLTLISEAVHARFLSAMKEERMAASSILQGPERGVFKEDREAFIKNIRQALHASKLISYAQGFELLRAASSTYGWHLDLGGIARLWRGGCIIRSVILDRFKEAFDRNESNLLLDPWFKEMIDAAQSGWRRVVCAAIENGIPAPAFVAALSYYDGYRCARSAANLLQAQRDYFGSHMYERVDRPRGEFFHTDWLGSKI